MKKKCKNTYSIRNCVIEQGSTSYMTPMIRSTNSIIIMIMQPMNAIKTVVFID